MLVLHVPVVIETGSRFLQRALGTRPAFRMSPHDMSDGSFSPSHWVFAKGAVVYLEIDFLLII